MTLYVLIKIEDFCVLIPVEVVRNTIYDSTLVLWSNLYSCSNGFFYKPPGRISIITLGYVVNLIIDLFVDTVKGIHLLNRGHINCKFCIPRGKSGMLSFGHKSRERLLELVLFND